MNRANIYIVISLILFCNLPAFAIHYQHYTTAQSLPSNTVYFTYRDSKGFMWFATDKGVSKYDGHTFRNFNVLHGVGDNEVFNFFEDSKHRLWLFTYNGIPCYIRNDSVYNATNDPLLRQIPVSSNIHSMYETPNGVLYFGYVNGGLLTVRNNKVKWIFSDTEPAERITIYKSGNDVELTNMNSIMVLKNDKITKPSKIGFHRLFVSNDVVTIADSTGIRCLKNGKLFFEHNSTATTVKTILHVHMDENGNLLCGTKNGLVVINIYTKKTYSLFLNLKITCIARDVYENYWVSTHDNGVFRLNRELDNLHFIREISNNELYYNKNGQLFFTEKDSIYFFLPETLTTENIPLHFPEHLEPIYIDKDFFIYSTGDTSFVYDRMKRNTYRGLKLLKNVYRLAGDRFVFVTHTKLYNAHLYKRTFIIKDSVSVKEKIKEPVMTTGDSSIFFLSGKKLYRYATHNQQLTLIDSFTGFEAIVSIYTIGQRLIAMTNSKRIIVYNPTGNYIRKIVSANDLILFDFFMLDNRTYLLNTNTGYLLLAANHPNVLKNYITKIEYPFRNSDILALYPYGNKILADIGGKLYAFDKKLLNASMDTPVMFINKVTVDGVEMDRDNVVVNNKNKLDINISVNTLGFNNSDNTYQYRLVNDGEKGLWLHSDGNKLNILIPRPGEYTIEIRAITGNNIVSATHVISVLLTPPFYNSFPFYALLIIVIAGIIFYSVRYLQRRRQRIFQNELNYLKLEQRSINSLLNPHFVFNTINNIQNLVNENSGAKANEYLANMSKLIRQNVENLQFDFIPIQKELDLIISYIHLQNLRFSDRILLKIDNNLGILDDINIPPLLIHTFVENAIVHGFDKSTDNFEITIDLAISFDNYLIISVTDNGIGCKEPIAPAQHLNNKTQLGIEFTRKRLQRLSDFYHVKYSLVLTNLQDTGTRGTRAVVILYAGFKGLV